MQCAHCRLAGQVLLVSCLLAAAFAGSVLAGDWKESLYDPGALKPRDSVLKVAVGQPAPDFSLPAVTGGTVRLSQFRGRKHVVLSFVPAAWTPVCSDQWPGYNIARSFFEARDAVLLGITVDNLPTLFAWTGQMGNLWFPVLSDFWPHGAAAERYGVLRTDGMSERALFFIDKQGLIRAIEVADINARPRLEDLVANLEKLGG
jgi:peroxiredoxin (alkyl hydroperoxide reductase subunit C)